MKTRVASLIIACILTFSAAPAQIFVQGGTHCKFFYGSSLLMQSEACRIIEAIMI